MMDDYFQLTYRIKSTRLPGYDYSSPGMYFVTFCTQHHRCYFGNIVNESMQLNQAGEIVREEIIRTHLVRDHILTDSWIVMPNLVHLIIIITEGTDVETPRRGVSTESPTHWSPGALGVIVNQLKGACTRKIRSEINPDFAWQARYYDHIIRSEGNLENLREYIQLNPANWQPIPVEAPTYA